MVSPQHADVDGKVWTQNNGFRGRASARCCDRQIETIEPFKSAPKGEAHNIYDVIPNSGTTHISPISAAAISAASTPRPAPSSCSRRRRSLGAAPRHDGRQDRLWFGEYRANRIGMFDTKTQAFKEWAAPTPWSAPYDVDGRQEWRSLDRLDGDRPDLAARPRRPASSSSICCRARPISAASSSTTRPRP